MTAAPTTTNSISALEAQTAAGRVRGRWRGPSAAFLGVPFAAPPIGELRFDAPAPVQPWDGVRAANWFDAASVSEPDRVKIGRSNAAALFKLDR